MNTGPRYSIGELAQLANTTVRTIRYYTEEGLLPQPQTESKYAFYAQTHVERLELIRRLKDAYLPLREIRQVMLSLSDIDVRKQLQEPEQQLHHLLRSKNLSQPTSTALDYLKQLQEKNYLYDRRSDGRSFHSAPPSAPASATAPPQNNIPQGETWSRFPIAAGIELSVREPISSELTARIQQIIHFARKLILNK